MKIRPVRTISRKPRGRCSSSILAGWSGFVDGEGCFSVSIHRNPNARSYRWLATPSRLPRLPAREVIERCSKALVAFFGCGRLRPEGTEQQRVDVRRRRAAGSGGTVLPFFERHPLRGQGSTTSIAFAADRAVDATEGASRPRRIRAARSARLRDERGRQATSADHRRDPCGILRDCTPGTHGATSAPNGEDTVRSSWRHEESGRNDLTTQCSSMCGVTSMPKVAKFLVG